MADAPISEELTALRKRARRRLVGAVALVLVSLAVLWSVMDDKPPQALLGDQVAIVSSSPSLAAPANSRSAPAPLPRPAPIVTTPLPEKAVVTPPPMPTNEPPTVVQTPPAAPSTDKPAVEKTDKSTPPTVESKPKVDPRRILEGLDEAPKTPAAATSKPGTFFLQIGAFADEKKADALAAKMRDAGVGPVTEAVTTDKGMLTRLRAGPFSAREAAEAAQSKLAAAGIASKVVGK
jgi:DedD protein